MFLLCLMGWHGDCLYSGVSDKGCAAMNLKQANESLNPLGLRVTKTEYGEYRVAFTSGSKASQELSAYYTDDIEDAEATGVAMASEQGTI